MITVFENFNNNVVKPPDLNSVSDEFWKMVDIADWNAVIKGYSENPIIDDEHRNFLNEAKFRVYNKYTFNQVQEFHKEYQNIYYKIYEYFELYFMDGEHGVSLGGDSYTDLMSSVIGKGKDFLTRCIEDYELVTQMAKNNDYAENFEYIFMVSEKEYIDIKVLFDPFFKAKRRYRFA